MDINSFLSLLRSGEHGGAKPSGKDKWTACCPAHDDKKHSLSIAYKDNKILLNCFAGCSKEAICNSLGVELSDLFDEPLKKEKTTYKKSEKIEIDGATYTLHKELPKEFKEKHGQEWKTFIITKYYEYQKENGDFAYYTSRSVPKNFRPISKVEGGWVLSKLNNPTLLYKLPQLIEAVKRQETIFICGGEEDVDNTRRLGLCATTNAFGEAFWDANFKVYFKNADVVILPDNDPTGERRGVTIAGDLKGIAKSIKVLNLPNLPEKGDISDWIKSHIGMSEPDIKEQLLQLVADCESQEQKAERALKNQLIKQKVEENKRVLSPEDIEQIREEVYQFKKPCHLFVAQKAIEHYGLCVTQKQNNKLFLHFSEGYWQEINPKIVSGTIQEWFYDWDCTQKIISDCINLIPSVKGVFQPINKFNQNNQIINLNNCAYDLVGFKAVPHSKEHYCIYKNDYDYDEQAQCPEFDKALQDYSCNDDEWIALFWEIAGYCLTGSFPFQKMFWFTGNTGRNGKGTVLRVLERLTGDALTYPAFKLKSLSDRFYKTAIVGKRLVTTGDLPPALSNIPSLKELTGGDKQSTDVKFGDQIVFTSVAKFVFAMNTLPYIPDSENMSPIAKRIILLPFDFNITKEDSEFEKKIHAEISGIFNKAVNGLKRLYKNREFTACKRGQRVLDTYVGKGSTISNFVSDCLIEDENGEIFQYEIWESYQKYMDINCPNWANNPQFLRTEAAVKRKVAELFPKLNKGMKSSCNEQKKGSYTTFIGLRKKLPIDNKIEYIKYLCENLEGQKDDYFIIIPIMAIALKDTLMEAAYELYNHNGADLYDRNLKLYNEIKNTIDAAFERLMAKNTFDTGNHSEAIYSALKKIHAAVVKHDDPNDAF